MSGVEPTGISAAPNASQIQGKLVRVEQNPDGPGSLWHIALKKAGDVAGLHNLAKPLEGQTIQVLVAPEIRHAAKAAEEIDVRVTYQGDARNGAFFLLNPSVPPEHA